MTTIFVSHSPEDAACAETIRQSLELQGYTCWREPGYPGPANHSYLRMIERAILASATLILIWNTHAVQTVWVARHIQIAQQFKKTILPVFMDNTPLPPTLATSTTSISGLATCEDAPAQLLPCLPVPGSQDMLLLVSEKAAHEFISNRRTAIDLAAEMLARGQHRDEVLALLEYLARNDLMSGVRERAQEVLDSEKQRTTPVPPGSPLNPGDAHYMLGVRCTKCNHITYFDRRRLCTEKRPLRRTPSSASDGDLDEMELPCGKCGHLMLRHVDCKGL